MQRMSLRRIFFKLMNNSGFGKTIENIRNHKNMKLLCQTLGIGTYFPDIYLPWRWEKPRSR